jgi:pimeloyl-ACP methyl ester carboxylesterase
MSADTETKTEIDDAVFEKDYFVELKDVKIHCVETGSGIPLILLHGNGEDLHIFDRQAAELKGKYRVIRLDTREHGLSVPHPDAANEELSFREISGDITGVMDALGIEKAAFLGFSDGANAALKTAVLYPERVLAAVSVGGNADPSGLKFSFYLEVYLKWLIYYLPALLLPEGKRDKYRRKRRLYNLMLYHPRITGADLAGIRAPVLILTGDHDIVPARHSRYLKHRIKNSKLIIFADAVHTAMFGEQGPEYMSAIQTFLDRVL